MESKALRYFQAVARHLSFTQAARELNLAQPALSMAIARLEQELELALFHRHDRRISLSDEGKVLLAHADKVLRDLDDARQAMAELRELERGQVRVGLSNMLGSYYFPPLLMAFRLRHPHLELSVVEGGTSEIRRQLEAGELDLGVVVQADLPPGLEGRPFLREQMLVTLPQGHPLAARQAISLEDFFAEELVLFQQGYFHRQVVDGLARRIGAKPRVAFQANLIPLITTLVQQGFGISTLMAMATRDAPGLVTRPFAEPVWLDLTLAWRRDRHLSRANQAFLDFLLAQTATSPSA
ncbi:LysR substrate-binding domain-containing protein [Gallaecimonas sp. GXIMD4217]|uniref:LysR family transcriptional regulator n=1 Tax=Gallaecimonas sp. GXIMD4217 TaxID=3131927 RepID=UPI00311AD629